MNVKLLGILLKVKPNECEINNDFAWGKNQWMWHDNDYICYNANSLKIKKG